MITLTTEHGTFKADTQREALKIARAAKRRAARQDRIDQQHRDEARRNAFQSGYTVLSRHLDKGDGPSGWRIYTPGQSWFPPRKREDCHLVYRVDTQWGPAHVKLYQPLLRPGTTMVGALLNGAGYFLAIWIQDGAEVTGYAVGVHEDQYALERLPNIPMDAFTAGRD